MGPQESHIHSVVNVLRYCFLDEKKPGGASLVSEEALQRLFECKELDYLTHVVIRMYENMEVTKKDPQRFRVELEFSPGAALSPLDVSPRPLHPPLHLPSVSGLSPPLSLAGLYPSLVLTETGGCECARWTATTTLSGCCLCSRCRSRGTSRSSVYTI